MSGQRLSPALLLLVASIALMGSVGAKTYSRCDLAEELYNTYNFAADEIADWVCLVEHESSYRTHITGRPNSNGSSDYGLFQINSGLFCGSTGKNVCNIDCDLLIDNDISDDVRCAKVVFNDGRRGFRQWYGHRDNCKDRDLSKYIQGCNVPGA